MLSWLGSRMELAATYANDMKDIRLSDIHRLLFGNSPVEFLIEAGIRTAVTFILLLALMKLLGKRMDGKVSVLEMAIIITIGAMAAVAFHFSDRGVLHAATALATVLIVHKAVGFIIFRSEAVENLTQGVPCTVVENGVLCLKEMRESGVSRENIMSTLRDHHIVNTGNVRRMYMEACGMFSIYLETEKKPGLCVLSPDRSILLGEKIELSTTTVACRNCGNTKPSGFKKDPCNICGQIAWVQAITEK
jgi:uncharacterized membrane protein YcaP (DUF421 family)